MVLGPHEVTCLLGTWLKCAQSAECRKLRWFTHHKVCSKRWSLPDHARLGVTYLDNVPLSQQQNTADHVVLAVTGALQLLNTPANISIATQLLGIPIAVISSNSTLTSTTAPMAPEGCEMAYGPDSPSHLLMMSMDDTTATKE